jgi:hypothetical protein
LLGAIERTHGYLSKTVIIQHFSGTESKAVTGLRLQRLPEFGFLQSWKKSHASGLIELLLEHGVLQQSEIRMGKLTVSMTPLGLQCKDQSDAIPIPVGEFVANAIAASDDPDREPAAAHASTRIESSTEPMNKPVTEPSREATKPNQQTRVATTTIERPPTASPVEFSEPPIRSLDTMPDATVVDAGTVHIEQPIIADWQWTLRLVRHGYRLGECALIRGKSPDGILADLTVAMQNGESVAIDQLFDRRTILAIKELRNGTGSTQPTPAVLMVFSGLWPFVQQWLKTGSGVH